MEKKSFFKHNLFSSWKKKITCFYTWFLSFSWKKKEFPKHFIGHMKREIYVRTKFCFFPPGILLFLNFTPKHFLGFTKWTKEFGFFFFLFQTFLFSAWKKKIMKTKYLFFIHLTNENLFPLDHFYFHSVSFMIFLFR